MPRGRNSVPLSFLSLAISAFLASAQEAQVQPAAPSDANAIPRPKSATSKDRLLYALPNFLTLENAGQLPPLSTGEKFKVVARGAFDYIQIPWYGMLAGINQAQNSEAGYGQGGSGYGKRFGASFVDGTIENFTVGAMLPSLLRQYPRFYQKGKGGFMRRLAYATGRILVTRGDSGGSQLITRRSSEARSRQGSRLTPTILTPTGLWPILHASGVLRWDTTRLPLW